MTVWPRRTRHRFIGAASCLAVLLAACSSSGSGSASSSSSTTSTTTPPKIEVAPASWHLPQARTRAAAAVDGGSIIVLGGQNKAKVSLAAVTRIDPVTGAAISDSPLPTRLHDAAAVPNATAKPGVWFIGGGDAGESQAIYAVDVGIPTSELGKLPFPRADLGAVLVNGAAYVIGGYDGKQVFDTVLRSTDGKAWPKFATLNVAVRYPAVTATSDAIWVFGGNNAAGVTKAVQRIDLVTGVVTTVAQFPEAITAATAATVNGVILVAGGRISDKAVSYVWRFDPRTNQAAVVGQLPNPVSNHTMVSIGDTAYVMGGESYAIATDSVSTIRVL